MNQEEALKRLHLYNAKAKEIEEHSFTKKILGERTGVDFSSDFVNNGGSVNRTGPEGDSLQAFKGLFRLFAHDGKGRRGELMFNCVWLPDIYKALPQSSKIIKIRDKVTEILESHERYMSSKLSETCSIKAIVLDADELTRRQLIDYFLYAYDLHIDGDRYDRYMAWKEQPILFALLENEFVLTLVRVIDELIIWIRDLNLMALEEVSKVP